MLRFRHQWDELTLCAIDLGVQPVAGCCADRVELPQLASTVLDLRHLRTGLTGTCGDPIKIRLPAEPEAYPLKLLLPAVPSVDPHCGRACGGRTPSTAFGVVLELPPSLVDAYRPSIVAPPPWKFVYDHNSLAGDACLGGYQEFGQRACVRTNYGGAIGFATETAPLPSLVALIDIQPGVNGAVQNCCPYLP